MASDEQSSDKILAKSNWQKGISSAHYLSLLENTGEIGFYSWTIGDKNWNASPGFYCIHGSTSETPRNFFEALAWIHPDDLSELDGVDRLILGGQGIVREFRIVRPDKTLRWIRLRAESIMGSDNTPVRVAGVIVDITRQREALLALKQCQNRLTVICDHSLQFICVFNSVGDLLSTDSWFEYTGQGAADAALGGWINIVHEDDQNRVSTGWREGCLGRVIFDLEFRLRSRDRHFQSFKARFIPLFEENQTIREWVAVLSHQKRPDELSSSLLEQRQDLTKSRLDNARLTSATIRGARGMLNWSAAKLAAASGVSLSTIRRLEKSENVQVSITRSIEMIKCFENAGIRFIELGDANHAMYIERSDLLASEKVESTKR